MKTTKCIVAVLIAFLCVTVTILPASAVLSNVEIQLNDEEKEFVSSTQNIAPIAIGVIPHSFPLSDCPPEAKDFEGLNIDMLSLVSEISGLKFEYQRLPIEKKTPYQALQTESVTLVAGTIKLDGFLNNPELVLSDRLTDGSAICIAKNAFNPAVPDTKKIAVMYGYQAGIEFSKAKFANYEIVLYPSNQDVVRAVRKGDADLAMISRYVGLYELQSPLNESMTELTAYQTEKDSCVMGFSTPENKIAISIINKALVAIGSDGYDYVQMNFSITHPYKLTVFEIAYKYRYIMLLGGVAAIAFVVLYSRLSYARRERETLSLDSLTTAYSEAGFELAAAKIISKASKPLFIVDFDICHFSNYNELHGKEQGDELLKHIVTIVKSFLCEEDVICRSYADNFRVLVSKDSLEELFVDINKATVLFREKAESSFTVRFGVYRVNRQDLPVSKMAGFAAIAKKSVRDGTKTLIGVFDDALLERHVSQVRMTASFESAIANKEFVAHYQPKFSAKTREIIGAEALARWVTKDGKIIPPFHFIDLFEKSGQIQQLDFYMLETVCVFLNKLKDMNVPQLPIAVNFSRVHLYSDDFVEKVNNIVDKYGISKHLIEIECTETTIINDIDLTKEILGKLQEQGFSIAMDDFGSAYSSLNTLCAIPLDVIKLDGGFLSATLDNEQLKAKTIISSVTTLAHSLSLKIVAEGVETEEQYLFLKSLDCDYIQGYYFSKPLEESLFLEMLNKEYENLLNKDN